MNKSQLSKNSSTRSLSIAKANPNIKPLYFCHFKNGMYMGSINSFQKQGRGLILHDNGTSMLCRCQKDMLHKDNVAFFSNGASLSAFYWKDKLNEVLYKSTDSIFYSQYKNGYPDGGAILVKLRQQTIHYISYRNGTILAKSTEYDNNILTKVFTHHNYYDLFPKEHLVNLQLQGKLHSEISVCKKSGKVLVGFTTQQSFMINGLGFVLLQKTSNSGGIQNEVLERGFYKNSQLSGFGQRNFKNGNNYIGQFRYDQFQGTGVLKNIHKKNWVTGNFQKGSLVQLIAYGNDDNQKQSNKFIQAIHQNKTAWVNKQLLVPLQSTFQREITIIEKFRHDDSSRVLQKKRSEVLRRIQDNFITNGDEGSGSFESSQKFKNSIVNQQDLKLANSSKNIISKNSYSPPNNHQSVAYSFIHEQKPNLSSSSRRNIFQSSSRIPSSKFTDNQKQKSSFHLQVQPVPMQTPKYIQSRILIKENSKKVKFSKQCKTPQRAPPRKSTPIKNSIRQNKNISHSIGRSKSASNINAIKLIDSMYKKNYKTKLF